MEDRDRLINTSEDYEAFRQKLRAWADRWSGETLDDAVEAVRDIDPDECEMNGEQRVEHLKLLETCARVEREEQEHANELAANPDREFDLIVPEMEAIGRRLGE